LSRRLSSIERPIEDRLATPANVALKAVVKPTSRNQRSEADQMAIRLHDVDTSERRHPASIQLIRVSLRHRGGPFLQTETEIANESNTNERLSPAAKLH
jgi:hypothetical protein